jgi:hypothetical protein
LCNIAWWALLAAATVGAIHRREAPEQMKRPVHAIFAVIGAVVLVTLVTFGVDRFHAPLVPLLCVLACYRRRS